MKHLIAICLFALSSWATIFAQITITSSDLPQADVTYPIYTAAITDVSLGDIIGADMTWDASDLISIGEAPITPVNINDASFSAAFVFNSPFNSAYQSDFFLPTEFPDLGIDIPLDGFNNFYQSNGDVYAIAGLGLSAAGFDLPVAYDDIDEILPLPLEYGAEMTSTASFNLDLTGILTYGLVQERQVVVDGWGTLILPSGSYEVLRTRTDLAATDDVFIEELGEPFTLEREQVTYQWWAEGMGFPLLEITEILGLPLVASFQDLSEPNAVYIPAALEVAPAFPNPVLRGHWIQWNETTDWSFMDIQGKELMNGHSAGFGVPEELEAGVYLVKRTTIADHCSSIERIYVR